MEQPENSKSPVHEELEERRSDSEVKDILNDLERLKSIPLDRKTRWVWELIQNAKDCALSASNPAEQFVDIEFIIETGKLTVTHNAAPFTLGNLVALVTRTSDKEYVQGEGVVSTGKYGTGFVTSHVLNRKVTVSGVLKNQNGLREFSLLIDRSADHPKDLRTALNTAYSELDKYYLTQASSNIEDSLTKYEYLLDEETYALAENSMDDLRKDLPFVLLINKPIRSVSIFYPEKNYRHDYRISDPTTPIEGLLYTRLLDGQAENYDDEEGMFHMTEGDITIAVPVIKHKDRWEVKVLEKEVRLFKEFPLVGTEGWHLPYFIQHKSFAPPETRDGIRTIKPYEDKADIIADKNRDALIAFRNMSMRFFSILLKAAVQKTYLLAESGFPNEKTEYTSPEWFKMQIQEPLRSFFKTQNLVHTASKEWISIEKAKIPQLFDNLVDNQTFYQIAAKFYGDVFPDNNSYYDWQKILAQDAATWSVQSFCTTSQLAGDIEKCKSLSGLAAKNSGCDVAWLDNFIGFCSRIGDTNLTTTLSLFPNQNGDLKRMQDVRLDPPLNPELKQASIALGISFLPKLLDTSIANNMGIAEFEKEPYYKSLNDAIGRLQPTIQTENQFKQLLSLISLFRSAPAKERERWYLLMKQLLPSVLPNRREVVDMEDFSFDSAEFASLRYACWLVQEAKSVQNFAKKYFEEDFPATYDWLNALLETAFRKKETYAELPGKFAILPMQDGLFRKLMPSVFAEEEMFDPKLKELYSKYAGKGNPLEILISNEIQNINLPKANQDLLTEPIDSLFTFPASEEKVVKGQPLHELFHELNNWGTENEGLREKLFYRFSARLPILYMKAYGKGMSKFVLAVTKLDWQPEDFEVIKELELKPSDLQVLAQASKMAGGPERLLREAEKIQIEANRAQWRQQIGGQAESSFNNSIQDLRAYNITNPDLGYDFEIHLKDFPSYFVEIKSTVVGKPNVQMSALQGKTARNEKHRYALCVVPREEMNTVVSEAYFKANAKFIVNIGEQVEAKVNGMENGLNIIREYGLGDVASSLEDEKYSVYVSTTIWKDGKSYDEFIFFLEKYFSPKTTGVQEA